MTVNSYFLILVFFIFSCVSLKNYDDVGELKNYDVWELKEVIAEKRLEQICIKHHLLSNPNDLIEIFSVRKRKESFFYIFDVLYTEDAYVVYEIKNGKIISIFYPSMA